MKEIGEGSILTLSEDDLLKNFEEYVSYVEAGAIVVITKQGSSVAVLLPYEV